MEKKSLNKRQSNISPESIIHYTVDAFDNGIAFGQHKIEPDQDPRDFYSLRLRDDKELIRLRSRYSLSKENPLWDLERQLQRLSEQGCLRQSIIYFGVGNDPFHPFEGRFDAAMQFLNLFQRYTPGQLVVQTRSPLIVIAMPVFKKLGIHASVTMPIETPDEDAVKRYTPGLPKIAERLRAATVLRRFGIEVTLQVSPVLPYGDWQKDAPAFASLLAEHGDFIYVKGLSDGSEKNDRKLKNTPLAQRLAEDRKFHWLRPDAANPLISALENVAPQKLLQPQRAQLEDRQMKIFAA